MRAMIRFVVIILLCSFVTSIASADDADDVRTAVIDLYAKLNAADADAVIEYMLPEGYTEFGASGGGLFTIDQDYLREAFASGIKADLEVSNLQVRVYGESAIVTGYRVGSVTRPGRDPREETLCLSMMWTRREGKWKLVHVHLSPHNP